MSASIQINGVTQRSAIVPFGVAVALTNASGVATSQKWEVLDYPTDLDDAGPDFGTNFVGWVAAGNGTYFVNQSPAPFAAVTFKPDVTGTYVLRLTTTELSGTFVQTAVVRVKEIHSGEHLPGATETDEDSTRVGYKRVINGRLKRLAKYMQGYVRVANTSGSSIARGKVVKLVGTIDGHTITPAVNPGGSAAAKSEKIYTVAIADNTLAGAANADYAILNETLANNAVGWAQRSGLFEGKADVDYTGFTVGNRLYFDNTGAQINTVPGSGAGIQIGTLLENGATGSLSVTFSSPAGVATSRQIISGGGLTGGGDLSADRTLAVGANADGSIIVNADDVQVGILATDVQHGNRGGGALHADATLSASGFMSAADKLLVNQLIAGWDITKTRYWLIDYDGGNDTNVGYVDATAGSTIAPAGLALKTMERFYQLCPVLGNGRASVVLQKPRAAGANYLKIDGVTLDSIDNSRFKGYSIFQWRGSTDLTNSPADRVQCGFMTAVAGPNGDGSFTADGTGATVNTFLIAAGSIGAEPAAIQFRVRFDAATATVALRNQCRVITAHTTGQVTVVGTGSGGLTVAPATGDTFFIERPGVRVDQIKHDSRGMSATGYRILQRQHTIIGIAATTNVTQAMCFSGPDVNIVGCEQVTLANNVVFNWDEVAGGAIGDVYFDDSGTSFKIGMGLRLNCSYVFQTSSFTTISALGMMNPTPTLPTLKALTNGSFGVRSYFAKAPAITGCGASVPNGLTPFTGFGGGFSFGETNLANGPTRVNAGGLVIDVSSLAIFKTDFANAGAAPCITVRSVSGGSINIEGCTGSTGNIDVGIDVSGAAGDMCVFGRGTANTLTGAAGDIRLAGGAITTHAGLATTNVVDRAGNSILGSGDRTVDQCSLLTNVDGTALAIGELVRVSATNNVVRAKADVDTNISGPLFVAVTPPANNAAGYFVPLSAPQKWVLHDAAPTLLALSYASPGTGGSASTTIPTQSGTNQKRRLGHVAKVSGSLGLLVGSPELLPITADGSL